MKFKQLIALAYAATAASLAIGWTSEYTRAVHAKYKTAVPAVPAVAVAPEPVAIAMETVITAARKLAIGHKLGPQDLQETKWPAASLPPGAVRRMPDLFASGQSRYLKTALAEGEVLLESKVSSLNQGSALAHLLPNNMRAVTIQVNEVRGVGGFIKPNDAVDILLTETRVENKEIKSASARVILQNIRVLAMGQEIDAEAYRAKVARSATLAVRLEDAQKLALATTVGQISLALRNPDQGVIAGPKEISLNDLGVGGDTPAKSGPSGKIEVIIHRGGRKLTLRGDGRRPAVVN